jgi:hypothetical protein
MKTNAILLSLATIYLAACAACDRATADKCVITPVGAQGISEDMDLDGVPDHAPFMVAGLSGTCPAETLSSAPVALYEQGQAVVMHGFGALTMLNKSCAMWTWKAPIITSDWGIAITPTGGTSAGVYSPDGIGMSTGARLPMWRDDGVWSARPPAGIPAGCKY